MQTIAQRLGIPDDDIEGLWLVASRQTIQLKTLFISIRSKLSQEEIESAGFNREKQLDALAELGESTAAELEEVIDGFQRATQLLNDAAQGDKADERLLAWDYKRETILMLLQTWNPAQLELIRSIVAGVCK